MRPLHALVCCSILATTACAADTDEAIADSLESPLASKKSPGLDVEASVASRSVGTPTYGYDPRGLFLTVRTSVEDSVVREKRPAFDGLERAFALVTVLENGQSRTVRLDALAVERGVAVGLDTNVGTVWAQDPGDDFVITK